MVDERYGRWLAWGRWLARLIGPALLVALLWRSDLALVTRTLARAERPPILLALALAVPFALSKGWRWQVALRVLRAHLPLLLATRLWCAGFFWGAITPGQSGDLARAWYLRRVGGSWRVGVASLALERVCDLALTLGIALLAGLWLWSPVPVDALRGPVLLTGLLLALGLALWWLPRVVRRSRLGGRFAGRVPLPALDLRLSPSAALALSLTSLLALSWTYLRIGLLCAALDIAIAPGLVIAMTAWLALLGPLSPAGLGTRDALLIVALRAAELPGEVALERALALSALILLLNLEQMAIGALCALRLPAATDAAPEPSAAAGTAP